MLCSLAFKANSYQHFPKRPSCEPAEASIRAYMTTAFERYGWKIAEWNLPKAPVNAAIQSCKHEAFKQAI